MYQSEYYYIFAYLSAVSALYLQSNSIVVATFDSISTDGFLNFSHLKFEARIHCYVDIFIVPEWIFCGAIHVNLFQKISNI